MKNRKFASGIAVIVCILSLLVGTNKSLASAAGKVELSFSDSGKQQPTDTIAWQLNNCLDHSLGLITVANGYSTADSSKIDALSKVRSRLFDAEGIAERSELNDELCGAFELLYADVSKQALSERDREVIDKYAEEFRLAQVFITSLAEAYNVKVDEYKSAANSFPAALFGWFVDSPERF